MAHEFIALPPDGAGKKLHTHSVEHEGVVTHNQIMTVGDPTNAERLQYVDEYGAAYTRGSEGSTIFDSFGKTKISQETIVGEYMPTYDTISDKVWTKKSGISQEIYMSSERSIRLQVDTSIGDSIERTTHKYHKYFPGTSQYIMMTLVMGDQGKAGVTRQWGYFDDDNGVYFEMNGTDFAVVVRSSASGTMIENRIHQTNFNGDKGDGSGISKIMVDPSKAQIFWIDLQWLGVGRVRFGTMSPSGVRIVHHTAEHANSASGVYMGTASLPIKWKMFNTANTGSTSEMKVLNAVVFTDSQRLNFNGEYKTTASANFPTVFKTVTNNYLPIVSIRASALYKGKPNRNAIIPKSIGVYASEKIMLIVVKNSEFDGTETWSQVPGTSVDVSRNMTVTTNGEVVYSRIVPPSQTSLELDQLFSYLNNYVYYNGHEPMTDTYTIYIKTIAVGSTDEVFSGFSWQELII